MVISIKSYTNRIVFFFSQKLKSGCRKEKTEKHTWGDWAANESKNNESMPAIEIDASNWAAKESVPIIQKTAKNKENREWKKEIQTFFAEKQQRSRVKMSSTPLLLSWVSKSWFPLSLIRFATVLNSASFFFSVLAF